MSDPVTARTPADVTSGGAVADGAADDDHRLVVEDLSVRAGRLGLVHDVSFRLGRGERVGLIGESGSGKSLTALAVMGLLPEGLSASGSVRVSSVDHDLVGASDARLADLRGRVVSMVFQEPMTALNPVMRVGDQVAEVMEVHDLASGRDARRRAVELLGQVQMRDPDGVARRYPHQLSGGQRQRVMLAMALANEPDVLVCDEPTTALDVTVQAQMLDLVVRGAAERDAALLFITHDLAVVATVCERVLVMYGGHIVEAGATRRVFTAPRHPYTRGLVRASDLGALGVEGTDGSLRRPLPTIPGTVPPAGAFPSGCVFRNRCERADEACEVEPPWDGLPGDGAACVHPYDPQDTAAPGDTAATSREV